MKEHEAQFGHILDPSKAYMLRLDGHKFSSFTKPFQHPFDVRIHNAMALTMMDLVEYFHCATGFTCSDEISLVFPLTFDEEEGKLVQKTLDFGGKVSKLVSLSAGYASVQFHKHLVRATEGDERLLNFIEFHPPHFDSRVFELPTNAEIVNNLTWRSRIDFRRNSIATMAQAHFSPRELHGVNTKQMLKMLEEKNDRWEDAPRWYRFGCFAKKEKYIKEVEVKGETVRASRTRLVTRTVEMTKEFTKDQEEWILAREWPEAATVSFPTDPIMEKRQADLLLK